jgi:thiamine biosynthesis lipoprotein ApbE
MRARQAVVVSRSATLAEALSLALLVLEPAEGLALVDSQPGCAGLLIEADGQFRSTPGWEAAVRFEPLPASHEAP